MFGREFSDVIQFRNPPPLVQKAMFGVLGVVGRPLGYRGTYRQLSRIARAPCVPWVSSHSQVPGSGTRQGSDGATSSNAPGHFAPGPGWVASSGDDRARGRASGGFWERTSANPRRRRSRRSLDTLELIQLASDDPGGQAS